MDVEPNAYNINEIRKNNKYKCYCGNPILTVSSFTDVLLTCSLFKAGGGVEKGGREEEGCRGPAALWSREDGAGKKRARGKREAVPWEGAADRGTEVGMVPLWPTLMTLSCTWL